MSGFDDLPTDLDGLAVVAGRSPSPDVRNEALRRLQTTIDGLANSVAWRFGLSTQERRDLVAEAFGHIGEKVASYDRSKARFGTWGRVVLYHLLIDLKRRGRRDAATRPGTLSIHGKTETAGDVYVAIEPALPGDLEKQEAATDATSPFSTEDLQRVRGWKLKDRIVLLTVRGLWPKVPEHEWSEWASEMGLNTPFPPAHYAIDGSIKSLVESLAQDLHKPVPSIARNYYRKRNLLRKLTYVGHLSGGGE